MMRANKNITWERFQSCNSDNPQAAFENLCRELFRLRFLGKAEILHSDPNNAGVEVASVLDPNTGKRISYQAKYFQTSISYPQIKKSAEATVKQYSEQIDCVYLYCNKDVTTTANSYVEIKSLLADTGIDFVPITNQEILSSVMQPEAQVWAARYFDNHNIDRTWFLEKLDTSLNNLGPRYNRDFNVETSNERNIHMFLQTEQGFQLYNERKAQAIENLKTSRSRLESYIEFISSLIEFISNLPDITIETTVLPQWKKEVESAFAGELATINNEYKSLDKKLTQKSSEMSDDEKSSCRDKRIRLSRLQDAIDSLGFYSDEKNFWTNKVMVIEGDAGAGKSHLLGNITNSYMKQNGLSILLLGHTFLTADTIEHQILAELGIDCTFDNFLNVLEGLGAESKKNVVIAIDAINESPHKDIWFNGLEALIRKISSYSHIRLLLSVRSTYSQLVFSEAVNKRVEQGNQISRIVHQGFGEEDVMNAVNIFFNHYEITLAPADFLYYEFSNPLLLKLYCQTHGEQADGLYALFDKFLEHIDNEVKKNLKIKTKAPILFELLWEFEEMTLDETHSSIEADKLYALALWEKYGLSNIKLDYMDSLQRSGFLSGWIDRETKKERVYVAYQKMEEYFAARHLLNKFDSKDSLRAYLIKKLSSEDENEVGRFLNDDKFSILCSIYPEKHDGEECVDILDQFDFSDGWGWSQFCRNYIESFAWRKAATINSDLFISFVKKHATKDTIERMLDVFIASSTRADHPLNADTLHAFLFRQDMNFRDYMWTRYINHIPSDERVMHLIKRIQNGGSSLQTTKEERRLLAIFLCWFFTSSNRFTRDGASKALIELLKTDFPLCQELLTLFWGVNDPYVIQRLFGVVFGACMKRKEVCIDDYKALAQWVYSNVFDQKKVYPDILLRDYARLIIERCIYEFPDFKENIITDNITPLYASDKVPVVAEENYRSEQRYGTGLDDIDSSMYPNIGGMYGDFGRYVFEAALSDFEDVDIKNLYHYAMQFIRDELKYTEKNLDGDNQWRRQWQDISRHTTKKVERIGKKYQWIAFYNILARLSDKKRVGSDYDDWRPYAQYKGAWYPYVRDFDPTLNSFRLDDPNAPKSMESNALHMEFLSKEPLTGEEAEVWAQDGVPFLDLSAKRLSYKDENGVEWLLLTEYTSYRKNEDMFSGIDPKNGEQDGFSISYSYLVKKDVFPKIKNSLEGRSFWGRWFPEGRNSYELFNREYGWSPAHEDIIGGYWLPVEVKTGKTRTKKYRGVPKFMSTGDDFIFEIDETEEQSYEEPIYETVGDIMPTYIDFLWEEQYDASQEDTTRFTIPNRDIKDALQLEQKEFDGYFYNHEGTLVAFDSSLNSCLPYTRGLLMRKDFLLKYLEQNNLRLFWTSIGEKRSFLGGRKQVRSEWSGFLFIDGNEILGNVTMQKFEN